MFGFPQLPTMEILVPAIVLGIMQFLKQFAPFGGDKVKRLLPLLAGVISAPLAITYQFLFGDFVSCAEFITQVAIYGFGLGLMAYGTF